VRQAVLVLALALAACGKKAPTDERPVVAAPSLSGATVLVLPVQVGGWPPAGTTPAPELNAESRAALDGEIEFALKESGPTVRWIGPRLIRRELARSPVVDVKVQELEVVSFRRAEVRRVGDPLFGDLRRLAAMLDARYALVPVGAGFRMDSTSTKSRAEIAAALIDANTGYVVWFGVPHGEWQPGNQASALPTAAQALARAVSPKTEP
jgi:hypothetical protein